MEIIPITRLGLRAVQASYASKMAVYHTVGDQLVKISDDVAAAAGELVAIPIPEDASGPFWLAIISETELPGAAVRIEPASCRCGGRWMWLTRRPSGAWESYGCLCHNQPPPGVVGRTLEIKDV